MIRVFFLLAMVFGSLSCGTVFKRVIYPIGPNARPVAILEFEGVECSGYPVVPTFLQHYQITCETELTDEFLRKKRVNKTTRTYMKCNEHASEEVGNQPVCTNGDYTFTFDGSTIYYSIDGSDPVSMGRCRPAKGSLEKFNHTCEDWYRCCDHEPAPFPIF